VWDHNGTANAFFVTPGRSKAHGATWKAPVHGEYSDGVTRFIFANFTRFLDDKPNPNTMQFAYSLIDDFPIAVE
jgi:hypothetical protein